MAEINLDKYLDLLIGDTSWHGETNHDRKARENLGTVEEAQYCMQHDYPGENWLHFFNGQHGYSAQAAIMAAEYYAPVNSRR